MLVTRAHTLDLTPEYREFWDLQKSIPGVVDEPTYSRTQIVPIAPKADPIRKTRNYNENLFLRTAEGNPMIDKAYKMVLGAA